MDRPDPERLSREELIELMLRLQRPVETSRTSSKPPSTDRQELREASRPGGGKPGHEGHSRILSEAFDRAIDHRPDTCTGCCAALPADLAAETVSEHDTVELPPIRPVVERHRRLAVRRPSCGMRVTAALPDAAKGTPFGARIHAIATYLKTFQALSYERLQGAFADLFGLTISQGGLMNMLRGAQAHFADGRDDAALKLRKAGVVSSDETEVRIEGSNVYHWVFQCDQAVVHTAAPTRGAIVVRTMMDGNRPDVWCSDRYAAQQDRRNFASALKEVYRAPNAEAAEQALTAFEASPWGQRYPAIGQRWRRAWIPFFAFPDEVRRIVYTTNAIKALNSKLRRAVRARGHFPSDDAATKMLYLILNRSEKEWKMPPREWSMAKAQFAVIFGERFIRAMAA